MRLTSRNVDGETTAYAYDGVGQLTKVTLPDASYIEYQYDPAHRLTEIRLYGPGAVLIGKTTYTLDAMGNRTAEQTVDPSNTILTIARREYNSLNRLQKEMIGDVTGSNPAGRVTTQYTYDTQGNLKTVAGPVAGATRTYNYDALNRLSSMLDPTVTVPGSAGAGTTAYAYNGLDQLTQVTDPRTLVTAYNYDGLGNLNSQVSPDTGATNQRQLRCRRQRTHQHRRQGPEHNVHLRRPKPRHQHHLQPGGCRPTQNCQLHLRLLQPAGQLRQRAPDHHHRTGRQRHARTTEPHPIRLRPERAAHRRTTRG